MAGYTRQSAADIVPGAEVTAAPLNAEFNQLQSAMHGSTGHNHQGGSGNGPQLSLTAAVTGILPAANGGVGAALTTTVDNTIPRFDGTGGVMQTSGVSISDLDVITAAGLTSSGAISGTTGTFTGAVSTGALTATSGTSIATLNATNLTTGTVPVARISGSYTSITGVGALNAGSITSGFGNINIGASTFTTTGAVSTGALTATAGTGIATLNASNLSTGTVASARVSGSYTGITGVGALNAGSISSGFGNIDNGASTLSTGGLTCGALSASGTGAPVATITRTGSSINSIIRAVHDGGSIYFGNSGVGVFGVGSTADVNGSGFFHVTSSQITYGGDLVFSSATQGNITTDTSDGSDTKSLGISGGGGVSNTRGARIIMYGNEHASFPGLLSISAGVGAEIQMLTAVTVSSTLASNTLTVTGDIKLSGNIYSVANNSLINLSGGSSTTAGANIELYGGSHATQANNAFYDAAVHTFRTQAGTSRMVLDTGAATVDVTGSFSASSTVQGAGVLTTANFSRASAGTLNFRPSGNASTTGQMTLSSAGNLVVAGTVTASSDIRFKTDVETIKNGLDKINQLRGVSFTKDEQKSIGLIAQEVREVLPELVHEDGDGYLSVAYSNIVGVLIEAVKELTERVKVLEAK